MKLSFSLVSGLCWCDFCQTFFSQSVPSFRHGSGVTGAHVPVLSGDIWLFITCEEDKSREIRCDIKRSFIHVVRDRRQSKETLTAAIDEFEAENRAGKGHAHHNNPSKHQQTRFTFKLKFMQCNI